MTRIALVGNPNAGKTTLFNGLTGLKQRVGNFPGITVEKKQGKLSYNEYVAELVDLPGVYSLIPQQQSSDDERVTLDYLIHETPDVVLNVLDATCLERHLYLTTQLAELGRPMVVILTRADVARKQGIVINHNGLEAKLGVPVLEIDGTQPQSYLEQLVALLAKPQLAKLIPNYDEHVESWLAEQAVESRLTALVNLIDRHYRGEQPVAGDIELDIASKRYQLCNQVARSVVTDPTIAAEQFSHKLDRWVLNPWLALPVFLGVMYLMFMFTIHVGGAFIDFFDIAVGAIAVDGTASVLESIGAPAIVIALLADGVGAGIQTVSTFIPIIGCLYLFLTVLEQSGYLARAAVVVDRLMNRLGLPGQAFVPMIMGFGCSVPAVMATRTLEQSSERVITSAMSHFMSCGARLPVYALFAAAFFPSTGQNMVFLLYLLGILMAILTGLALRHSLLPGESSSVVLELPNYERPHLKPVLLKTWQKLKGFVVGAGKIIVIMVTCIGLLNSLGTDGTLGNQDTNKSLLSKVSQTITPLFYPMGIEDDNWQATVGIFTGVFAKEVVVGTLNNLYQAEAGDEEAATLMESLEEAVGSVTGNLVAISGALLDPLGIDIGHVEDIELAAEEQEVSKSTYTAMQERFNGAIGAFAYLLFVLMYIPCASATGTIAREIGLKWAVFIGVWSTLLAYCSATAFYQGAYWILDGSGSVLLCVFALVVPALSFLLMRTSAIKAWFGQQKVLAHAA
ncbi:ferrous iron transport protein B [Neiella marina]|uniref:Ferrous iron transport protein B n=1 Tax=Neiella holothuriorum TaxID=2870530 RepID=A0ABS7EJH1_9GAMM|nr:ferrous iron transport protein B [Neiella holothuriorum]MBW8192365.1 ferrous iron transport protein B [Neiella holothuriorum]